jgi:chromosome segregation ATPase
MKIYAFAALLLLAVLFGTVPPGQASAGDDKAKADQVKKETKQLLQALKNYTAAQRDEAIEKTRSTLEHLDRRIDALEKQIDTDWDTMDRTAQKNARASLKELRWQRTKVAEWFGGLKNSSIEAWDHMKEGLADAFNSLHQAWEKSEKEFSGYK